MAISGEVGEIALRMEGFNPQTWDGVIEERINLIRQTPILKLCSHLASCMLNSCPKPCAVGVYRS